MARAAGLRGTALPTSLQYALGVTDQGARGVVEVPEQGVISAGAAQALPTQAFLNVQRAMLRGQLPEYIQNPALADLAENFAASRRAAGATLPYARPFGPTSSDIVAATPWVGDAPRNRGEAISRFIGNQAWNAVAPVEGGLPAQVGTRAVRVAAPAAGSWIAADVARRLGANPDLQDFAALAGALFGGAGGRAAEGAYARAGRIAQAAPSQPEIGPRRTLSLPPRADGLPHQVPEYDPALARRAALRRAGPEDVRRITAEAKARRQAQVRPLGEARGDFPATEAEDASYFGEPEDLLGPASPSSALGGGRTYPDPAPRSYEGGFSPDTLVRDHNRARALGGDPNLTDWRYWAENARKAGFEGNYKLDEAWLMRQGLTPRQARLALLRELRWIRNDIHADPVDPALLEELPPP